MVPEAAQPKIAHVAMLRLQNAVRDMSTDGVSRPCPADAPADMPTRRRLVLQRPTTKRRRRSLSLSAPPALRGNVPLIFRAQPRPEQRPHVLPKGGRDHGLRRLVACIPFSARIRSSFATLGQLGVDAHETAGVALAELDVVDDLRDGVFLLHLLGGIGE